MNSKKKTQGFTVLHLTILIAVIAILTAIFYPSYLRSTKSITGSEILSDMRNIEIATTKYFIKYGSYPDSYIPGSVDNPITENQKNLILLIDDKKWPTPPLGEFIIEKIGTKDIIKGTTTKQSYYKYNHNKTVFKEKDGISIAELQGHEGKEMNLNLMDLLQ